jgi:hypothetical protein
MDDKELMQQAIDLTNASVTLSNTTVDALVKSDKNKTIMCIAFCLAVTIMCSVAIVTVAIS